MPPSGVDYASEFLNGYAPEYVGLSRNSKKQLTQLMLYSQPNLIT